MITVERLPPTKESAIEVAKFLLDTFAQEHLFGSEKTTNINTDRAWAYVLRHVAEEATWVARKDGGIIIGSIAVGASELWWTDRDYLADGWFYVAKEFRGTKTAIMLLHEAEKFAQAKGLPLVVNVFHSGDVDRTTSFLGRMGFANLGGRFIKETPNVRQ